MAKPKSAVMLIWHIASSDGSACSVVMMCLFEKSVPPLHRYQRLMKIAVRA